MPPMKLEDVLRSVVEDSLAEFRAKIREIEEEGLRRLRDGADELSKQAAIASQSIQRESNALRMRLVSQAMLEARREYLESVEQCVNTIVKEAMDRIPSLKRSGEYRQALRALLREALEVVGSDEVVVECAREDQQQVRELARELGKELGVKIRLSENSLDSVGGVRVIRGDGSMIYDNTVEARLERMREEIRGEIIKRLLSS
ncbi:V-type proton ATPase subunit E [Candidatus Calditenuaceae archaeon HR02]|nr:V-type proton ATPase subunit E [Candidatus Calditenuaceae archaeon HR02]